ncbi:MAG: Ppx/GppA phosphatase family protein [Acidimicrobiales bacterium]
MSSPVAAIDIGTNSTRLLIADPVTGQALERRMVITRLGEGVDATGALGAQAIDRTVAVLNTYRQVMDSYGVSRLRSVATSAARDAANRDLFFDRAISSLGKAPELLDGMEEGRLSFIGAVSEGVPAVPEGVPGVPAVPAITHDSPGAASAGELVVDIGGGSTEIIFGNMADLDGIVAVSLDIGCVRLTERYLHHDPPETGEIAEARQTARDALTGARSAMTGAMTGHCLIGLAGTVSTIAALDCDLAVYDREKIHHAVLERSTVRSWAVTLASEPAAARLTHAGMARGREDVIVGGAIILDEAMEVFDRRWCIVSESDILDGIARSLFSEVCTMPE